MGETALSMALGGSIEAPLDSGMSNLVSLMKLD
jgi:hypothetical protein